MKEERVIGKMRRKSNNRDRYVDTWDIVGVRDPYKCPECEYLGYPCDRHSDRY